MAEPPLGLEDAITAAESATRDVLRAQADVLLVDVDKARALAAVLPSVTLSLGATELFSAQNVEGRYAVYEIPGCTGDACGASLAPGGTYDLEYRGFEEGRGSSFWLELPLPAAVMARAPSAGGAVLAPLPLGLRVLVAEDNAVNQALAQKLLQRMGCEV